MPIERILFDGWELSNAPLSPPALHTLDLLAHFPKTLQAEIALPAEAPDWLAEQFTVQVRATENTPSGKQRWEQRTLPHLAAERRAGLHIPTSSAPLTTKQPVFISPSAESAPAKRSFRTRLRRALGRGGMARARVLWPEDVPVSLEHNNPALLSPAVHPAFEPKNFFLPPSIPGFPDLPESFFLVHTRPGLDAIRAALEAWTWAAGPIGEVYPLLFLGLPDQLQKEAEILMRRFHLEETVQFYPAIPPTQLHLLYQAASAVFHPAPIDPWSSPMRYGIACSKPVVGIETAITNAVAGPAAYFAPAGDPRGLGAALISIIVRDDIRKQIVDHTRHRAAAWSPNKLTHQLENVYLGNNES